MKLYLFSNKMELLGQSLKEVKECVRIDLMTHDGFSPWCI